MSHGVDGACAESSELTSTSSFRFLDLPGEIHNLICHDCVVECENRQHDTDRPISNVWPIPQDFTSFQILQVCKQTHREASPIMISANTWRTTDLAKFRARFLSPPPFNQIQGLRKLRLVVNDLSRREPLQVSREDGCYLHTQLARLFYSDEPELRNLQELQVPNSFIDITDLIISEAKGLSSVAITKQHVRRIRQTGKCLIISRATCNLVRLGLFDQHQLTRSFEVLLDPPVRDGLSICRHTSYLTRMRSKKACTSLLGGSKT